MNWAAYSGLFGFSMIKFLFAPFAGPHMHLNFFEIYISCCAGAIVCATAIYFSSEYLLKRAHKKRVKAAIEAKEKGIELKVKKKFTRTNKFIVKLKRRLGIVGIAFYAPLFLSIPIGTIITAKFYGKLKKTYPLIVVGILVNGAITTCLAFLFK